ncbi:hypothetical protein EV670_1998 [Rivibacter subsaxonicus]|uniref:Uncharacterized protein n=2 Tax=Rivibacter subsaxonicus TaxID=457575 RepID=A0A4Q7VN60_9BURK|nr:hypothetical protein EV670_1998 [Rivibacter subsaxonicus]
MQEVLTSAACVLDGTKGSLVSVDFGDALQEAIDCFQLRDSHLSTEGARRVVVQVMNALDLSFDEPTLEFEDRLLRGDLAGRFAGDQRELVRLATRVSFAGRSSHPVVVDSVDPSSGHKGMRRVWKNAAAPFPHRVVAMANSFFERGGASTQLSWWFSHLFAEFHFCWDPELDEDYVSKVSPDIVICQTIERFLRAVPAQ